MDGRIFSTVEHVLIEEFSVSSSSSDLITCLRFTFGGPFFCTVAFVVDEVETSILSGVELDSVVVDLRTLVLREDRDFVEADEIDEIFDCDLEADKREDVEAWRTEFASEISLFCRVLAR